MLKMREYMSLLKKLGLQNWIVNRKLSMFRLALRILFMILTIPLYLFGYVNNYVPRAITKHFTNKIKDPMLHSSFQYVLGTVAAFPIFYLLILAIVWIVSKHFWIALLYILLTFLTAFFVHYYKIAFRKLRTFFRARFFRKTDDYKRLCQLNTEINQEMEGIIF